MFQADYVLRLFGTTYYYTREVNNLLTVYINQAQHYTEEAAYKKILEPEFRDYVVVKVN